MSGCVVLLIFLLAFVGPQRAWRLSWGVLSWGCRGLFKTVFWTLCTAARGVRAALRVAAFPFRKSQRV